MALNGFLNLATGLAPIFRKALSVKLEVLPDYLKLSLGQQTSALLSVLLGVVLIGLGKGLYERKRRAWAWSLFVLAVLLANNLYRGTTPHTSVVTVLILGSLVAFRSRFAVRPEGKVDYTQVVAIVSVIFALAYGIAGSYVLRAEFKGIESFSDALYFTFVTYSTVGYGDILPDSPNAKIFTISMILIGLSSFVTALTLLVGPVIEARMKGVLNVMKRFQGATNHVIVCGYTNVSESVIDELQERQVPYLIVEDRAEFIVHLKEKGNDVLGGDATRRETLDSENILVAVTASKLRGALPGAKFRIIVRVEDEENIEKAREVGADEVISPSTMGGRSMAAKAAGGGNEH